VVIEIIDKNNVLAFKFESYSPIAVNSYRVIADEAASQLM
jgi:hypothetical protein